MMRSQHLLKRLWPLLIGQCISWKGLTGMKAQLFYFREALVKILAPGNQMARDWISRHSVLPSPFRSTDAKRRHLLAVELTQRSSTGALFDGIRGKAVSLSIWISALLLPIAPGHLQ